MAGKWDPDPLQDPVIIMINIKHVLTLLTEILETV
jgi:hypothetical protein